MDALESAVLDIVLNRGFHVWKDRGYLFARTQEASLVICKLDGSPDQVRRFLEDTTGFQGRRVLATMDEVPPYLQETMGEGLFIWDRRSLEAETGLRLGESIPIKGLERRVRDLLRQEDRVEREPSDEGSLYL